MAPQDAPAKVCDMPAHAYHSHDSVSNTMLSAMNKSPAHCYALHLAPNRPVVAPTEAMIAGTLAHTAILEPDQLLQRYVVKPRGMRFSTKEGMAWRDAQTLQIVSQDDFDTATAQHAAMLRDPSLAELLTSPGDAEASFFWTDPETKLRCRCRVDRIIWTGEKRVKVLDVKTISDLTPQAIRRAVGTYGYHRQEAHYTDGLRAMGLEVEEFVFGFVSGSYPFLAAPYVLDDATKDQGRDEVEELRVMFAECKRKNHWPVTGGGYQVIGLPAWASRSSEVEISYE